MDRNAEKLHQNPSSNFRKHPLKSSLSPDVEPFVPRGIGRGHSRWEHATESEPSSKGSCKLRSWRRYDDETTSKSDLKNAIDQHFPETSRRSHRHKTGSGKFTAANQRSVSDYQEDMADERPFRRSKGRRPNCGTRPAQSCLDDVERSQDVSSRSKCYSVPKLELVGSDTNHGHVWQKSFADIIKQDSASRNNHNSGANVPGCEKAKSDYLDAVLAIAAMEDEPQLSDWTSVKPKCERKMTKSSHWQYKSGSRNFDRDTVVPEASESAGRAVRRGVEMDDAENRRPAIPDEDSACSGWTSVKSGERKLRHVTAKQRQFFALDGTVTSKLQGLDSLPSTGSVGNVDGLVRNTAKQRQFFAVDRTVTSKLQDLDSLPSTGSVGNVDGLVKKKKKTDSQRKKEYRNKVKKLPSIEGKVLKVTQEFYNLVVQGESSPRILQRHDESRGNVLAPEDFPTLGGNVSSKKSSFATAVADESEWSDIDDYSKADTLPSPWRPNSEPAAIDFPKLGDASLAKSPVSKLPLTYSSLLKQGGNHKELRTVHIPVEEESKSENIEPRAESLVPKASGSKRAKANSLIQLDLMKMIIKKDKSSKIKATSSKNVRKRVTVKPVIANILDSSAPRVRRGKEREKPARKRPTAMKKIILKERESKKTYREASDAAASSTRPEMDSQPEVDPDPNPAESEKSEPVLETEPTSNEELPVAAVSGGSGADEMPDENVPLAASELLLHVVNLTEITAKSLLHTRKFREYCNHMLSPEIDEVATTLIQDLIRFHDRVYQKDPIKAKMRRRMVMGLREVTKHLRLQKIKCLILAPNLEKIKSDGGLDDSVNNIILLASEQGVPFVFALGRRKLGRVCLKKVPVSCIGIFNYDGSENNFKRLCELALAAQEAYQASLQKVSLQFNTPATERLDH